MQYKACIIFSSFFPAVKRLFTITRIKYVLLPVVYVRVFFIHSTLKITKIIDRFFFHLLTIQISRGNLKKIKIITHYIKINPSVVWNYLSRVSCHLFFTFSSSTQLELLRIIIEPLVAEFKGLYGIGTRGKTCTWYFQIIF